MTNAVRQRRKHERRRAGLICLRIEAHEHDLAQAMLNSGRLTADEALRRPLLERAAGEILEDFVQRWSAAFIAASPASKQLPLVVDSSAQLLAAASCRQGLGGSRTQLANWPAGLPRFTISWA
jgi:hypothetical protein